MAINKNGNLALEQYRALQAGQIRSFKNPGFPDPRTSGALGGGFPASTPDIFKPVDLLRPPERQPLQAPPKEQAKPANATEIARNLIAEGDKGPVFRPEKDGALSIFEINDLQPSPLGNTPARTAEEQRVLDVLDNRYDIISNIDQNPFGITTSEIDAAFADRPGLTGKQYFGVEANSTDFRGQDLSNADLRFSNLTASELSGVNLQGADLGNGRLTSAQLKNANLQSANLQGASMVDANLEGANLQGANLNNAQLTVANLKGANLQNATFGKASINGADFTNANLRGANLGELDGNFNFKGAIYDKSTILPATFRNKPFDPLEAGMILADS